MKKALAISRFVALIFRSELRSIASSPATLLVILGGVVFYSLLYGLLYHPNVIRDAPIVVIDESGSHLSRELIERIDASPEVLVIRTTPSTNEAHKLLDRQQAQAILYLPHDFAKQIGRPQKATIVLQPSTNSLLYYEAIANAITESALAFAQELRNQKMWLLPQEVVVALANSPSPQLIGRPLFNTSKGYANYLIPPVLILIIFQTITMAITMTHGQRSARGVTPTRGIIRGYRSRAIETASRTLFYTILYALLSLFLFGMVTWIFDLPHQAPFLTLFTFLTPFLIATALFGQAFARLFRGGEDGLLLITFFSVGLIFLSGISFPLHQIPLPWRLCHYLFPATVGIVGYVGIGSMGASLSDIAPQLGVLLLQSVGYFLIATLPSRRSAN